jgi:mRNA interferase RelE/StbE
MPPKVDYSDKALKQLAKIDKSIANDIMSRIDAFAETGTPRPKPLSGLYKGMYRLRFGDWRAVFEQTNDLIMVVKIAWRDKVYKR